MDCAGMSRTPSRASIWCGPSRHHVGHAATVCQEFGDYLPQFEFLGLPAGGHREFVQDDCITRYLDTRQLAITVGNQVGAGYAMAHLSDHASAVGQMPIGPCTGAADHTRPAGRPRRAPAGAARTAAFPYFSTVCLCRLLAGSQADLARFQPGDRLQQAEAHTEDWFPDGAADGFN
jgi:hypothetical protein